MKILNLIWKFGTGGIAKCFLTYAALDKGQEGLKVFSACIDPQNCDYDRKPLEGIGVEIISIKSVKDFSWMQKTRQLIKDTCPDIIFCHGFNGPIVVTMLKIRYGIKIPMICSYHGAYYAPTPKKKWIEGVFNGMMYFLYRHIARRIVVVSEYSKRELVLHHVPTDKLVVVHNGIENIDLNPSQEKRCEIRIGVVSRLDPFKGIDVLITALESVKKKTNRPFTMDVVGNGPMEDKLRKGVKEAGLEHIVNFVGYQTNITEWMERWDIFCLPSFFENHSLSILEAMRSGKAIVTTKVGGNEESVTDGEQALTVVAKEPDSLADALVKLIEDNKLRERLGYNARRRFLKEFTEDTMKRNLIEVLTR